MSAMVFRLFAIATLIGTPLALLGGCDPPPAPVAITPPAPPPPPPAEPSATSSEVAAPPAAPKSPVPLAEDEGIQSKETTQAAQVRQPPIHLSAGVAVPQLLPEGTQVGVSVDYGIRGELKSYPYVLIVESSAGELALPVKLSPMGGTLQEFLPPSVRPEHKPFKARIDERPSTGQSVRASNTVVLQTSY